MLKVRTLESQRPNHMPRRITKFFSTFSLFSLSLSFSFKFSLTFHPVFSSYEVIQKTHISFLQSIFHTVSQRMWNISSEICNLICSFLFFIFEPACVQHLHPNPCYHLGINLKPTTPCTPELEMMCDLDAAHPTLSSVDCNKVAS